MKRPLKKIHSFFFASTPRLIIWQATLWDRFAKLIPIIILVTVLILYLTGEKNWDILIDGIIIFLIVFGAIWWLWIIYTVATIAVILDKSQHGLKEVIKDIKEVQKEINDIRKDS
jgi:hypothetical protein